MSCGVAVRDVAAPSRSRRLPSTTTDHLIVRVTLALFRVQSLDVDRGDNNVRGVSNQLELGTLGGELLQVLLIRCLFFSLFATSLGQTRDQLKANQVELLLRFRVFFGGENLRQVLLELSQLLVYTAALHDRVYVALQKHLVESSNLCVHRCPKGVFHHLSSENYLL